MFRYVSKLQCKALGLILGRKMSIELPPCVLRLQVLGVLARLEAEVLLELQLALHLGDLPLEGVAVLAQRADLVVEARHLEK